MARGKPQKLPVKCRDAPGVWFVQDQEWQVQPSPLSPRISLVRYTPLQIPIATPFQRLQSSHRPQSSHTGVIGPSSCGKVRVVGYPQCRWGSSAVPWLQVGERYVLERLLGTGSFSSVCQALDTVTGERVRPKESSCSHFFRKISMIFGRCAPFCCKGCAP